MKKTNVWVLFCSLLLSSVLLVSCDDDDEDADALMEQDRQRVAVFFQNAAVSDMFEIQTGQMAQVKGETSDVETLGAMLVRDHTLSSNKIMDMADERDIQLQMTMPAPKQQIMTRLNGLDGLPFDKDFAAVQVQAHQEAIALYEQADKEIKDAEVQAFIDETLPKLRTHLQHARDTKTKVDGM
ncbi:MULTISPECIES: DUF4142 domain-containing protein [Rufibacter]|uniref:Putative membrane protein n=1 Tax=Rufibacter quisquiliarum TaxID=1549639 RepID=A0A839GKX9_9BACT|nr:MULTISPECIES: DUF4142 domain-containing protein [Rufibacter]MBA9075656.1 putative membrane protein [Rufibacter quisquiliarum]